MDRYYDFFLNHVSKYDLSIKPILRKKEHTLRVLDNCTRLAESLHFTQSDIKLASLIGLFHDIGRFEQWRIYQSYNDQNTTDHAKLGLNIIEEAGIFKNHPEYHIILSAIDNHNKFQIDPNITNSREKIFCQLIRDADKLDIFRELISKDIAIHPTTQPYDEDAVSAAMNRQLIDRRIHKDEANHALAALAMFNDIYFDYTKQCIRNESLIEKLTERFIESNPEQSATLHRISSAIKAYY